MYSFDVILRASCITLCLAFSLSGSTEDTARDYIDHVLSIPNTDKVLNSVLGRLERNRELALLETQKIAEEEYGELAESLPEYTESLQTSRKRGLRQLGAQKHYPICHLERKVRRLNTNEHEYRPAYYEEVRCTPTFEGVSETNEVQNLN